MFVELEGLPLTELRWESLSHMISLLEQCPNVDMAT